MLTRSRRFAPLALVAACWACSARGQAVPPMAQDLAVETFDAAWAIINKTHFDTTFNGVNWPAVKDELRPRAHAARTLADLRRVIADMVGRLGQSHFSLIPREASDATPARDTVTATGTAGFDVRWIEDRVLVSSVEPGGPATGAGVRPGWELVRIDDTATGDLVAAARRAPLYPIGTRVWSRVAARLSGAPGEVRSLEFRDAAGRAHTVRLTLDREESQPVKFGNLPTFFARFASRRVDRSGAAGADAVAVGVIWFNFWMVPLVARVDRAVHEFRGLDGIVLDLRGNRGGVGVMVTGVAGHFIDRVDTLGQMRTRTGTLMFISNPRRVSPDGVRVTPFAGPVAVLTDEGTGSASELFAGGMQSVGRVRVFGDATVGGVLPAAFDRLPNGDVLYHAIGDFTTATGTVLEGRGVIPDTVIPLMRDDLLAGRDPVLEAALEWIAAEKRRASKEKGSQHD